MKGVSLQDVIASGDEARVREKLVALLQDVGDGMGMPITIYCAQLCAVELERQAAEKIAASSKKLERLTKVLIWLTVVLAILTLPLSWEVTRRFFT
jgi:hypothetical protein